MPDETFTVYAICECGHRSPHTWEREALRRQLASAVLRLKCPVCGALREATPSDIAHLRLLGWLRR